MILPELPAIIKRYVVWLPEREQNINPKKITNFRITSGWHYAKTMIYPEILVAGKWVKVIDNGRALTCMLSRMLSSTRETQIKQALIGFMKDLFKANNFKKSVRDKKKEAALKDLEEKNMKIKKVIFSELKLKRREEEIASYKASLERQNSGSGRTENT